MRFIQFVQTYARGDAVSNDAAAIGALLRKNGFQTGLYAEYFDPALKKTVRHISKLPAITGEDVLIYHHSIACGSLDIIRALPCRKIMVYHNITPGQFFVGYDMKMAMLCDLGRRALAALSDSFDYVLADSDYNRQELRELGYSCPIDVRPILIPYSDYDQRPDQATIDRYRDGWVNILFVGRVAPNKKQEDVIRAFNCYKKCFNPRSRLILAGSTAIEEYAEQLKLYIELNDIRDVIFPGHISFAQLLALYQTADVFLCMSEHEGFCVPLLEAMYFNVPVVARAAAAVPGTLGGAGILLPDKNPALAAAAVDRLVTDAAFRQTVIEGQRRRLDDFSYERVSSLLMEQITGFLNSGREQI